MEEKLQYFLAALQKSSFETLSAYGNDQFCKRTFYSVGSPESTSLTVPEPKKNKTQTPPDLFSRKMPTWWLNPCCRSAESIAAVQVVLTLFSALPHYRGWPIPTSCLSQHPKFGGTGNRSGKTFFIKLNEPWDAVFLSSWLSEAGIWRGWSADWGTGNRLPCPQSFYCTKHLLTSQSSLYLDFPKNYHDENYHLSNLNYS